MSSKQMPLVIGGAVFAVIAVALGAYLALACGKSGEADEALGTQKSKLRRLSQREVFPSAANTESLGAQLQDYETYLDALKGQMREGQTPATEVTRDIFQKELAQMLRSLTQMARSKGITVPSLQANFLYGFERYRNAMVQENDLNRLMSQVKMVNQLCTILFESGIKELVAVERQLFEGGPDVAAAPEQDDAAARRRRRRGGEEDAPAAANPNALFTDPDGMFTKEHFALVFKTNEKGLWTILDRLAKGTPFTVVTRVEIDNAASPSIQVPKEVEPLLAAPVPVSTSGFRTVGQAAQVQKEEEGPVSRDLRVVAGMEIPTVKLELDVYRFADAPTDDAEEEGEP